MAKPKRKPPRPKGAHKDVPANLPGIRLVHMLPHDCGGGRRVIRKGGGFDPR